MDEMTPDNFPSVRDQGLTPLEQQAKAHWKRFLPNLSRELENKGQLDTEIRRAAWRTEYETELQLSRDPSTSRAEMASQNRSQYLFLPPEPPTTPAGRRSTTH